MLERLTKSYASILKRVGDPLDDGTLYGPLHSVQGVQGYQKTIQVTFLFVIFDLTIVEIDSEPVKYKTGCVYSEIHIELL